MPKLDTKPCVFYCMEVENPQSFSKARKIEAKDLATAKRIASRNRVFVGTTLVLGNSVNGQGFVTEPVCVKVSDEKWKTVEDCRNALIGIGAFYVRADSDCW